MKTQSSLCNAVVARSGTNDAQGVYEVKVEDKLTTTVITITLR